MGMGNRQGMNQVNYTIQDLKTKFFEAEASLGRVPKSRELSAAGAPPVSYYIRAFGSWNKFLTSIGKEITIKSYTRKVNPKRFFFPSEWHKILGVINNQKHKFFIEFLMHTGMRFDEADHVELRDINFETEMILVKKAKGGHGQQRDITISNYLIKRINAHMKTYHLGKLDTLKFPSIQYMNKILKKYANNAGIPDNLNFSCHTLRKTLENWLVALNINIMTIQQHMGHTLDVAHVHYIANTAITNNDKILIRQILDNLFNK